MTFLLVAVAAFFAAAINSVAGGGTFLTFPTLTGPVRLNAKVANMTSTIGLWPGSAASIVAARRDFRRISPALLTSYCLISVVGGVTGAILLRDYTRQETFNLIIPWLLLAATLIFAASDPISRWASARHGKPTVWWLFFVGVLQLGVAVYGGYFGAGIGVLMLAGLSFAGLEDIRQINALKVLLATLINGVASIVFLTGRAGGGLVAAEGGVSWSIAAAMAGASVIGGFLGMAVARRLPRKLLRTLILLTGVSLTTYYFIKAYR